MDSKKLKIPLIFAVIGLWGYIGYQFLNMGNEETEEGNQFLMQPSFGKVKDLEPFTLDLKHRDPFLGKVYREKKVTSPIRKSKKKVATKPIVKELKWPNVAFKGLTGKVVILDVDGRHQLLKKGAKLEDYELFFVSRDSIGFKLDKHEKYYSRN